MKDFPAAPAVFKLVEPACENCRFMDVQTCHRYPPQPKDGGHGEWPHVRWHNWCGEFQPK